MKTVFILLFTAGLSTCFSQSLPKLGRENTLEIANWNLEWFGKTTQGYGPENDSLQQKLAQHIIDAVDIDIWALCEISDKKAYDSLTLRLPAFSSCLSSYLPEQKTAFLFRKNMFEMHTCKLLGTADKDSFSTMRFPLELKLIPKYDIGIDTLTLVLIHLKANTGNDSLKMLAYNSRKRSSEWLNMYIRNSSLSSKTIVLGDWNDDLDKSIYNGLPSPFIPLLNSSWTFISKTFTDQSKGTVNGYQDAIDHQLISPALHAKFFSDSCFIFRPDLYISGYSSNCSDHFPVYSLYNTYKTQLESVSKNSTLSVIPNPAKQTMHIAFDGNGCRLDLFSSNGSLLLSILSYRGEEIDLSAFSAGMYTLLLQTSDSTRSIRFQIAHE